MQRSISLFAIPLVALALAACDDVSPVDYRPPPPQDATVPDADPERIAECRECMLADQGACRPQYEQCAAGHPLCAPLAVCLTASDCWRQFDLSNIGNRPQCAESCYLEVGLGSLNEVAAAAAPLFICLRTEPRCSFSCFGIGAPTGAEPD